MIDTPEFQSWFGDSQVVDEMGRPLVVHHGTSADIQVFNTQGGRGKTHGTGVFFSSRPEVASTYAGGHGGNVMPVYLKLHQPVVLDAGGRNWNRLGKSTKIRLPAIEVADDEDEILLAALQDRVPKLGDRKKLRERSTTLGRLFPDEFQYSDDTFSVDDIARWARKTGYDGLIIRNVMDHGPSGQHASDAARVPADVYVAFEPVRIKSAIGNSGRFDPDYPGITDDAGGVATVPPVIAEAIRNPKFREWFAGSQFAGRDGLPIVLYRGEGLGGDFSVFARSMTYENAFFFTKDPAVARDYARGQEPRAFFLQANRILDLTRGSMTATAFVQEWAKAWESDGWIDRTSGETVDPWDVVASGRLFDYEGDWSCERWRDLQASIEAAGYDAAILPDAHCGGNPMESVIVFRPEQIKSADKNNGRYDPENPDIYDQPAPRRRMTP